MFKREKKTLVYQSKNQQDYEKAQELLREAGIDMKAWATQETPVGGCGCKIDVRKVAGGKDVPKEIFHIEVAQKDGEQAAATLKDRVLPVRNYGFG